MNVQSFASIEFAVMQWMDKVGISKYGTTEGQLKKLVEEVEEVMEAHFKKDKEALADGIGDVMIVLVAIGMLNDLDVRKCFFDAAQIVTKRKGHMTPEGIFVKES